MHDRRTRLFRGCILALLAIVYILIAWNVNTNYAPDEVMRYQIPSWIRDHAALPRGDEAVLTDNPYGFSYAFRPYLASLIAVVFMGVAGLFGAGPFGLLFAARLVSVCSGILTVALGFCVGDRITGSKRSGTCVGLLMGCLPQFAFISGYLNNDAFALLCGMAILYMLLRGRDSGWCWRDCIFLGLVIGADLLSYYNAYGWIVAAVLFCVADCIGKKRSIGFILSRAGVVMCAALAVAGWYFVRNIIIYQGDLLGNRTMLTTAAAWEAAGHKINHMIQPRNNGIGILAMLLDGTWLQTSLRGMIGIFGNMSVPFLGKVYYAYFIYFAMIGAGLALFVIDMIRSRKVGLVNWCLLVAAVIPVVLSVWYSWTSDYQPQGRYLMPALPALAVWMVVGFAGLGKKKTECKDGKAAVILTVCWVTLFVLVMVSTMIPFLRDPAAAEAAVTGFRH